MSCLTGRAHSDTPPPPPHTAVGGGYCGAKAAERLVRPRQAPPIPRGLILMLGILRKMAG